MPDSSFPPVRSLQTTDELAIFHKGRRQHSSRTPRPLLGESLERHLHALKSSPRDVRAALWVFFSEVTTTSLREPASDAAVPSALTEEGDPVTLATSSKATALG